eukprot:3654319-Prymnesium_polylepis.1
MAHWSGAHGGMWVRRPGWHVGQRPRGACGSGAPGGTWVRCARWHVGQAPRLARGTCGPVAQEMRPGAGDAPRWPPVSEVPQQGVNMMLSRRTAGPPCACARSVCMLGIACWGSMRRGALFMIVQHSGHCCVRLTVLLLKRGEERVKFPPGPGISWHYTALPSRLRHVYDRTTFFPIFFIRGVLLLEHEPRRRCVPRCVHPSPNAIASRSISSSSDRPPSGSSHPVLHDVPSAVPARSPRRCRMASCSPSFGPGLRSARSSRRSP